MAQEKTAMTTPDAGTFTRGKNAGTAICVVCGKRRQKANIAVQTEANGDGTCVDCYEAAGIENAHEDGYHANAPDPMCPDCTPAVAIDQATTSALRDDKPQFRLVGNAKTQDELRTGDVTTMTAADVAKARVQDRADAIKAKQNGDRKAARTAAVAAAKVPPKKATGTTRAQKVAAPTESVAKRVATPKAGKAQVGPSKAERVRVLLDQGKTVREVANALDDVTWAYAWDIAAAWEKKTGKVVIPSHMPAKAKKVRAPRTSKKAPVVTEQEAVAS